MVAVKLNLTQPQVSQKPTSGTLVFKITGTAGTAKLSTSPAANTAAKFMPLHKCGAGAALKVFDTNQHQKFLDLTCSI